MTFHVATLVHRFCEAAHDHGHWTDEGRSPKANAAFRRMSNALRGLQAHGPAGAIALGSLLSHSDRWVRLNTAAYLLDEPSMQLDALRTLEGVAESPGFAGLTATMTLTEWRKGAMQKTLWRPSP